MQWFKSKIEHAVEKAIAKKIENLMEEEDNEIPAGDDYDVDRKLYIRLKLVNDVLTIVLNDGSILTKTNATQEDFVRARDAVSEEQLYTICTTQEVLEERRRQEAEAKRLKALQQGIQRLAGLDDFEIEGNSVKLRGTGRTMPQLLVEKFIQLVDIYDQDPNNDVTNDEEYQALKRFFMWCCLNPRAEVANDLYEFLNKNSFRITKQGFFVALRNIVTLHGGTELVQFVSNAYNKIKAVWKKKPEDYTVFLENGEYKIVHFDDGRPARFEWVAPGRVSYTTDGNTNFITQYTIDGTPAPMSGLGSLVTFQGLDEGVLQRGARTLRSAIDLETAMRVASATPMPSGVLKACLSVPKGKRVARRPLGRP